MAQAHADTLIDQQAQVTDLDPRPHLRGAVGRVLHQALDGRYRVDFGSRGTAMVFAGHLQALAGADQGQPA